MGDDKYKFYCVLLVGFVALVGIFVMIFGNIPILNTDSIGQAYGIIPATTINANLNTATTFTSSGMVYSGDTFIATLTLSGGQEPYTINSVLCDNEEAKISESSSNSYVVECSFKTAEKHIIMISGQDSSTTSKKDSRCLKTRITADAVKNLKDKLEPIVEEDTSEQIEPVIENTSEPIIEDTPEEPIVEEDTAVEPIINCDPIIKSTPILFNAIWNINVIEHKVAVIPFSGKLTSNVSSANEGDEVIYTLNLNEGVKPYHDINFDCGNDETGIELPIDSTDIFQFKCIYAIKGTYTAEANAYDSTTSDNAEALSAKVIARGNQKLTLTQTIIIIENLMKQQIISTTAYKETNGIKQNLESFSIPTTESLNPYSINKEFTTNQEINLKLDEGIKALSFSGEVELLGEDSLVRVILVDQNNNEYLVYESYSALDSKGKFSLNNVCEETCNLDTIEVKSLKIQIENAKLTLNLVNYLPSTKSTKSGVSKMQILQKQNEYKINQFNENLKQGEQYWYAGETTYSLMSYSMKKQFFKTPEGELPNLGGFEYYNGGIFILPEEKINPLIDNPLENLDKIIPIQNELLTPDLINGEIAPTTYLEIPDSFDWRDRHGENWVTPVKCQAGCFVNGKIECVNGTFSLYTGPCANSSNAQQCLDLLCEQYYGEGATSRYCGSCYIFGPVGALEANINLQYNQKLNLDLSEQQILDCSGSYTGLGCGGGYPGSVLSYIQQNGIGYETNSYYKAKVETCTIFEENKIYINDFSLYSFLGTTGYLDSYRIKENLIQYGPLSAIYWSWAHAMTLAGYGTIKEGTVIDIINCNLPECTITIQEGDPLINQTYFIMKNSAGTYWGDQGYVYLIENPLNFEFNLINGSYMASLTITTQCVDKDKDGYFWWGIGPKPRTCPICIRDEYNEKNICHEEEDFDDANPTINIRHSVENYCGDTFLLDEEQCEADMLNILPVENSQYCANNNMTNFQECHVGWVNYSVFQSSGVCGIDCLCTFSPPTYLISNCSENNSCNFIRMQPYPRYCYSCEHLNDGIKNCNEFEVDKDVKVNITSFPAGAKIYQTYIDGVESVYLGLTPKTLYFNRWEFGITTSGPWSSLVLTKERYTNYRIPINSPPNPGDIINVQAIMTRKPINHNVAIKD